MSRFPVSFWNSYTGGGGGATISSVSEASRGTSDTSFALAAITFTVTAGKAYAFFVKLETNAPNTVTLSGANTGTMTAGQLLTNGALYGRWYYVTSMASSGSTVFTGAASGGLGEYARCWLWEITYTGTLSADVDPSTGTGTATTATSASFTTTGTSEVILAGVANDTGKTYTSPTIAGSAATTGTAYSDAQTYYRILSGTVSSQTAAISYTGSTIYCAPVLGLKAS